MLSVELLHHRSVFVLLVLLHSTDLQAAVKAYLCSMLDGHTGEAFWFISSKFQVQTNGAV